MDPSGDLAATFLDLLREAGLPVVVVTAIGTAIALWQLVAGLNEAAYARESHALKLFASSSRRLRAYGLFVISHVVATVVTVGLAVRLMGDPSIADWVGVDTGTVTWRVGAGIVAYFLVVDWWSLRHGDVLPLALAVIVGTFGGLVLLFYGGHEAVEAQSWAVFGGWFAAVFGWFTALGWASSTGAGLARAIQRA